MTTSISIGRRLRSCVALLSLTTALCTGLAAPAFASSPHPNLDANGVDLTDGTYNPRLPIYSIGSGQAELALVAAPVPGTNDLDTWSSIYMYQTVSGGVTTLSFRFDGTFDNFKSTDGYAASTRGTGATVTVSGNTATYTTLDGLSTTFTNLNPPSGFPGGSSNFCNDNITNGCYLLPTTVASRSGMDVGLDWTVVPNCADQQEPDQGVACSEYWRLNSVSNSAGYSITWTYTNPTGPQVAAWFQKATATFGNTNVSGASPVVTYGYPSSGVRTITTPGGKVWRITGSGSITGIRRPSASSDTTTISYGATGVSSVTNNGITTGYSYSVSGSTATMVVTDALSHLTTIVSDMTKFRPTSVTDALSRTTTMSYDSVGRPTQITYPEGNYVQYAYDSRGNLTTTTKVAKSGSGLANIVTSALFASSCTDASCNEPITTTDALGNVTNYAYGTTGLVISITAPAATAGATRPQTRYSYATSGVAVLTGISTCQAGSSCAGSLDEVKTAIGYDSNLNVTSVSKGAGDASLTATSAATYDRLGNLLTVDGPLSGTADTTTYRYDADRARVGAISPDPDGAGSLKRRAQKVTYNTDGQPTVIEAGTVSGTTDTDWMAFTTLQQSTATYDANARRIKDVVTASGTTYAVAQYSYDAVGRPECTALRMNSGAWSSLPSSACTLGTIGSYGADRIAKTSYDAAGEETKTQNAYGSSDQADDATGTYNSNGTIATLTDGQGNKTTYEYDGFDRLSKTRYPSTTVGAGSSSTTDYEQLAYDAGSEVTSRRLRDGNSIGLSYDHLGRLTTKDLPGSELDVFYTYDLLGRPLSAATSAQTLTFTYDALSRNLTQGGPLGTVSSQYDLAGRRTRLTYPDTFYASYDYLITGEMSAARENGATSGTGVLATYIYDDLGRRTSLMRGNGTSSSYGYDNASRLISLGLDHNGSSYDQTLGFAYSPARQIASVTRSNDAYAYGGAANRNDTSSINGLNQTTSVGVGSLGYDSNGNLNNSGGNSFTFSSENLLLTGPSSATLTYDPLLRLYQESGTSIATARFQYDGQAMIGEYDTSGALQKRYVYGSGADEPLVEYDLSGGSFVRAWLATDERGSVVAQSNDGGTTTTIDSYDEYGVPASGNTGRFGYTGQAWLPSLGIWYYKARMYSPRLARFMQTDPTGYSAGPNWYNFVANDPVNMSDPSGLSCGPNDHLGTISGSRITRCLPNGVASSDGTGSGVGNGDYVFVCVQGCGPSETNGDEIIVTAALYIAIPVTSRFHHYSTFDPVCNTMASYCSVNNAYDLLLRFPDPGSNGEKAVSDRQTSLVPGLGPIQYRVDPGSHRVTNVTLPGHLLYFGTVSRVVEQHGAIIGIGTYGNGNGRYGALNSLFAGPVWGDTDLSITVQIPYSH